MGFLAPSAPAAPVLPPVPPAAYPATMANPAVAQSGQNQRAKAGAAAGAFTSGGTDLTGGQGLAPPKTAGASLLSGAS